jgi:D-alanyl-D-alanine carboxypeptidase (penicillin-binding protein 5/6)
VRATAVREGQPIARARLDLRPDESVALVAGGAVKRIARRGEELTVRAQDAPRELTGPLAAGSRVGTVVVRQRGRIVGRVPLVTAGEVQRASLGRRLRHSIALPVGLGALALVAAASLLAWRRKRRRARNDADGTYAGQGRRSA